ncbi:MAG: penicillin acylase family protein [Melioribacteraceae bacterium]|nr:penicillin acylase family protein [Melioribacteraceae bacterium]
MLESSLPDYYGEKEVDHLSNNVDIYRDEYGVAYVMTNEDMDAYFALGYLHAQERLFQMDLSRRAAEGRLSEIFGNKTVKFDKLFRTLDLIGISEKNYENYDTLTRNILEAYSKGVNQFINNSPEKFTIEFDILGYTPYEWKPVHSLAIAKLMSWELNISWWSDIAFTHLIQKFGNEKVKDILPDFDENGPIIIPKEVNSYSNVPTELIKIDKDFRNFIGSKGTHIGSNNWVVNGKRSVSGKPIIANDPHLGFAVPGKWYVVSLTSPSLKVDGFSLPGVPAIVIGKNMNISWVVTNIMADDSDFYIETVDSTNNKYYYNGDWNEMTEIEDTIIVKDSSDVIFTISKTHRGPIVSGLHNYNIKYPHDFQNKSPVSMRWSGFDPSNELLAFYKINTSKNWKDFEEGLSLFHSPGQNFIYADIEGNIGYIAGVKLPKRKYNSSSFVYDGASSEYEWDEFIPFDQNPAIKNPSVDFLASANNKVIEDYPYHISNIWEPISRISRIVELIESKEKHSVDDFKEYQNDFYSHYAKEIVPYISNALKGRDLSSDNAKIALKILNQWDFVMSDESQVAAIYAVIYQELLRNIFMDEMGEAMFNEYVFLANVPLRVVLKLLHENKSNWFDDINTSSIENRDDIIERSFYDALDYLENEIDDDIKFWQWGKLHTITFEHFFHGKISLLDKLLDIGPFTIGGDGTTVFNSEYYFSEPFDCKLGPSMRFIYDFSDPNKFEFVLPTGQSGHFFSEHYNDMTSLWLNGEYISINTNIDTVKSKNYKLLRLIPASY